MYQLFYWTWQPKLMCTFADYSDCKKAVETLKEKYPLARIWVETAVDINSFEEWMDKFNGEIADYKLNN